MNSCYYKYKTDSCLPQKLLLNLECSTTELLLRLIIIVESFAEWTTTGTGLHLRLLMNRGKSCRSVQWM